MGNPQSRIIIRKSAERLAKTALLLHHQGQLEAAKIYYQKALQQCPDWPEVSYNLGIVLEQQQDLAGAVRCYQQAIAQNPNYDRAHYNLAVALQKQGLMEVAIQSYEKAIELNPQNPDAYSNLGCLWLQLGQFSEAIQRFQQAIALAPEQGNLYNNLGQAWFRQGKIDPAISCYLQGIRLQPDLVEAYQNLGKAFQQQGLLGVAVQYYKQALHFKPDSIVLQSACAFAHELQNEFLEAIHHFKEIIALEKPFVEAYCQWVEALPGSDEVDRARIACGQFLSALQQHQAESQIYDYWSKIHLHLGNALAEYRDFEGAEIYYKKAILIQPNSLEHYLKWGECLVKQGRFNAAAIQYHKALGLQPNSAEIYDQLKAILEKQEQVYQGIINVSTNSSSTLIRLPAATISTDENRPKCQGLDCQPCLKRIFKQFQPLHLGEEVYECSSEAKLSWDFPEPGVTILPQGRAWIAPQRNWWHVCNAIAIINSEGELLPEYSRFYPAPLPGCENFDPRQHQVFALEELPPLEFFKGRVAVLSGLSGNVYFHWMVDILPQFDILSQHQIDLETIDWFVVNSTQLAFQRETLQRIGIPDSKIIESDRHSYIQADTLIVPAFPAPLGWSTPRTIQFLRQQFAQEINSSKKESPQRIYISRNRAKYRKVLNESEVLEILEKAGFVTVELETLTVAEQVQLFAHANMIVAPHGAGLTNLIFCQPQTTVIELMPTHYIRHYYWLMSQHLNLKHYYLKGKAFQCEPLRQLMYQNPLTEDIWISLKSLTKILQRLDIMEIKPSVHLQPIPSANLVMPQSPEPRLQPLSVEWLKQAKLDFANQNLEQALIGCQQELKQNPQSAEAYKIMGDIRQIQGQIQQAQTCYQRAIQLQPDLAEAYANLGSLYGKQQQWKLAIECYQKTLNLKPDSAETYRNLAKVWKKLNQIEKATECSYQALDLEPEKATASQHLNLGKMLLQQGKEEWAIACFRYALDQEPTWAEVQDYLRQAQHRLAEKAENTQEEGVRSVAAAKAPLSVIINTGEVLSSNPQLNSLENRSLTSQNPENEPLKIAQNYLDQKQYEQAVLIAQQWIEEHPQGYEGYEILGKGLQGLGKNSAALKEYRKLAQLKPNDPIVHTNLGNVYAKLKQWKSAIEAYQTAIALKPDFAVAYRNLGKIFNQLRKEEKAVEYWYRGLSLQPQEVKPAEHVSLGNRFLKLGKWEEAETCYRRAISFDPTYAEAYHNLGEVLATQGKWEEAITQYRRTIELNPSFFESYNSLGKALVVQGRWPEVIRCYRQALTLNPRVLMALQNLTKALIQQNQGNNSSPDYRQILKMMAGGLPIQPQLATASPNQLRVITPEVQSSPLMLIPQQQTVEVALKPAEALYLQQNYSQCLQQCQQIVRQFPQEASVYKLWGKAFMAQGKGEEAKRCFEKGLALQPQEAEFYLLLGEVYAQEQTWHRAIPYYQKAIQLQPTAQAYRRLSQGWKAVGQTENAEDCLFEAFQLERQQPTLAEYLDLAEALWQRGQRTQAMMCYGHVLIRDPQQAIAHPVVRERLQAYQHSSAIPAVFKPEDISNPHPENGKKPVSESGVLTQQAVEDYTKLLHQAILKLESNDFPACVAACHEILQHQPQRVEAYSVLGRALQAQGHFSEAIAALEKGLKIQPKDGEMQALLGDCYAGLQQWDEAIRCYQVAVQLNSKLVSVQEALGDIWLERGNWQEAIAVYQQVILTEPQLWEVHHKLGDALRHQGNLEEAVQAYQKAAELVSSDPKTATSL